MDHTSELKYLDEAFRVFLELLWLQFLVNVKVLNAVLQGLYYFQSLGILALLVNFKVFKQFVSIKLGERCVKNLRLVFEKLVDYLRVAYIFKNLSRQMHNCFQRLIKVMRLQAKLDLCDFLSGDTFIVEFE